MTVPVIDVDDLRSGEAARRRAAAAAIGHACEHVGFLAVVGHGIADELTDGVLHQTRRLFALPDDVKLASSWTTDRPNRGYDPTGHQRLDADAAVDLKEAWAFGPEHLAGTSGPMQRANVWPDLDGFRSPVEAYHRAAMELCERLLRAMALALDLDEHHFAPFHTNPVCTLRLLHYPPRRPDTPPDQLGSGAHTDWGAITVLLQDDSGSLEVQDGDGRWVPVEPEPGALVVNVGDLLAQWTNDRYRSTRHRVIGVPDRSRYSVACFFDLDHDAVIECLPTCVTADNPARYPPTVAGRHLLDRFQASIAG